MPDLDRGGSLFDGGGTDVRLLDQRGGECGGELHIARIPKRRQMRNNVAIVINVGNLRNVRRNRNAGNCQSAHRVTAVENVEEFCLDSVAEIGNIQ